jgi:hypothetical protein
LLINDASLAAHSGASDSSAPCTNATSRANGFIAPADTQLSTMHAPVHLSKLVATISSYRMPLFSVPGKHVWFGPKCTVVCACHRFVRRCRAASVASNMQNRQASLIGGLVNWGHQQPRMHSTRSKALSKPGGWPSPSPLPAQSHNPCWLGNCADGQ